MTKPSQAGPRTASADAAAEAQASPDTWPASAATDASALAGRPSGTRFESGCLERQPVCGRYIVLGLIGGGGMGTVYKVRDLELDEVVALKMLRPELVAEADALERFRREVKVARRISHPGIARTFDIGEHEGERCLTMEFVEGESLAKLLAREGALVPSRCVEIASAMCDALAAAHAAGVVHRDLSPANVLIEEGGRVVITDFGIASAASMAAGGDAERQAAEGTPAYMAPEQVLGESQIDGRADIYALGALLFEACTGERAWQAPSPFAVAAARLLKPPPDPRERRADVPPALARIVQSCMARRPQDRYRSAELVARALAEAALELGPAASEPAPGPLLLRGADIEQTTVAVLPLSAESVDDLALAEVLTDDLIDRCSMTRALRVRSRGAVLRYRGAERDARDIGRELGVQVVAEGSVRRGTAGQGTVRLGLRLVSVPNGFQIWAGRFERQATDLLGVIDEAARALAAALAADLPTPDRDSVPDAFAVELYLRARYEYRRFWPDNVERAVHLFERALARAPEAPVILAGLAMALARRAHFAGEGLDAAREAAEAALRRAPDLADARLALASVLFQAADAVGAVREARVAIARSPGLAEAHLLLGRVLVELGRVDEGTIRLRAAVDLDQRELGLRELARTHALCGSYDRAHGILDAPPEPAYRETFRVDRARLAVWQRDASWAREMLGSMEGERPARGPGAIAVALAELVAHGVDPRGHAEFGVPRASGLRSRRRAFMHQIEAEVAAFVGDAEAAALAIHRSVEAGLIDLLWLERCPLLEEARRDPRALALVPVLRERADEVLAALGG